MRLNARGIFLMALVGFMGPHARAIEIVVDYRFDTQNFFDTQEKRNALQAAADRYSRIITSPLLAVSPDDSVEGWRIGFSHPGTGESYQISSSPDSDRDPLGERADEYGFPGLVENQWILFAGGYELSSAGVGGTATGLNFETTFDDFEGPLHRGLIPNTPTETFSDLPVWGGAISFDTRIPWHFDVSTSGGFGSLDFYSIALHEIGHALGLGTEWNQLTQYITGNHFEGPATVASYNEDNGTSVTQLDLESQFNLHWKEGAYQSSIFPFGEPLLIGTVGLSGKQDLLMEPATNFVLPQLARFELTNVDVAALTDIGWSVLSGPDLDVDENGVVDVQDVNLACAAGLELSPYYARLQSLPGDLDFDGRVAFPDFLRLSTNFGMTGHYADGDFSCDGMVAFADFLILSSNFGRSHDITASVVPEPAQNLLLWLVVSGHGLRRRRGSRAARPRLIRA